MKVKLLFFLLSYLTINNLSSQNLLINGDFETGGNGIGFDINGTGYNAINPPFSGVTLPGDYAFVTDPQPMNPTLFISSTDHTNGSGKMLVIDGNTTAGQQRFWRAGNTGNGICGLTVGYTYTFSYWIKSVSGAVVNSTTQADIGIQVTNANAVTLASGNTLAPLPASGWQKVVYTFVPTATCVTIELWDNNTGAVGNDFAVDDFSLTAPLSVTYSLTTVSCPSANDATISVYGIGGAVPYVSYALSGAYSQTNTTGVFTALSPGIYNVSVTDSNGITQTKSSIVIGQGNDLSVTANSSICIGNNKTLNASGGTGYTWTASPADASLVTPNISNPTISPAVNTVYTVTSTTSTNKNLVFNGDFTQGNAGFTSDYQYINPTNTTDVERAYGVVYSPVTWAAGYSACTDHTSTTGRMMVVNGSNTNSGNDKVWSQTIAVTPGQNYTFSYYVQSLTTGSPASIETTVNGVSIGTGNAPAGITCGNWTLYTYTWNSGTNTTAQITLRDKVTASAGNDFAIDDISFTTTVNCNLSKSVTITVNPLPTATFTGSTGSICPGYSTLIKFTGTPNATVNFTSSLGPDNIILDNDGKGSYMPFVMETTQFSLVSVVTDCTIPLTGTVTITVSNADCPTAVPTASVAIATHEPVCNPGDCTELRASYFIPQPTTGYTVKSIPYQNTYSYLLDPGFPDQKLNADDDDIYSPTFTLPFNFCFYGQTYNKILIGSNGLITFNIQGVVPGGIVPGSNQAPWDLRDNNGNPMPLSHPDFPVLGAIYGVYQDTDIRDVAHGGFVTNPTVQNVNYHIGGVAPNRYFLANFNDLPLFSCGNSEGLQTSQIILYESTNVIDVQVKKRSGTCSWNSGSGVIGIQNINGTSSLAAPGRDTGDWSTTFESWRFVPSGGSSAAADDLISLVWEDQSGTQISTDESIIVCPAGPETYKVKATFTRCDGTVVPSEDSVTVDVEPQLPLNPPADVNTCSTTPAPFHFNINQDTQILNTLSPLDYEVLYYENEQDAKDYTNNNILNPNDYIVNSIGELPKTLWVRVTDLNTGTSCGYIRSFDVNTTYLGGTIAYPPGDRPSGAFCNSSPDINVINSADLPPGGQYIATPNISPGLIIDQNTGKISSGSYPGTYSVVYTVPANGVCGEFSTPPVNVAIEGCLVTVITPLSAVCPSDSFNLSTSDGGIGMVYTWSDANGIIGTTNVPNLNGIIASSIPGSYTYSVTVSDGITTSAPSSTQLVVTSIPQVTISGPANVCTGASVNITFTGTPNTIVTYDDGSGTNQTISIGASGVNTLTIPSLSANITYQIVSVELSSAPYCTQTIIPYSPGSSITVTVGEPDATVSIANPVICSGTPATFTITGTPGGVVDYIITSGSSSTTGSKTLDSVTGTGDVISGNLTAGATITLTNITSTGSSSCSKALTGSVSVTVNPLPVASFSAALAAVCSGQPAELHFTGTPGATVTFTGGSPAVTYTTVLDALGASTVTAPDLPALTVGTTYTLQSIQSSDAVPCTNTLSQSLTVGIKELPQITAPPPVIPVVCTGEPFTLSVSAMGTAITYTWYHDTTAVGTGPTYTNPSPGVSDGGDYTVVVSNDCGTVTSGIYTVLINAPTVITVPPSGGGAVCAGQPIDLSITATGVGLSYQWYRDTVLLVGETNTALHIPSASAGDAGSYTCHVINTCQTVISNAVVFTVDQLPQITVPPSGPVAACTGTPFSLSVTATGTGLSYQWFHDGTAIPGPDAILPVYTVNSAVMSDAGAYTVEVSGTCSPSVTSAPVQVTISQAPGITGDPQGRVLCSGEALSLSVVATGGPGLTYQWERNGQPIAGATGPGLNIAVTAVSDSGLYHVIVANPGCAPITSADALVTVNQAPVIIDEPKDVNICLGDAIILTVTASGSNLSYQWMFNNLVPVGTDSHEFTIPVSAMGDSGNYTCIISSPSCPSIVSRVAEVFVNALPEATIANGIEPSICAGFSADVKITGTKNAVVSYTVNGGSVQTEPINPSGSLIIPTGDLYQDTVYELLSVKSDIAPFCEADLSGLATSTVVVRVNPLPAVSLEQEGYICIDSQTGATTKTFTYETGLDVADYSFKWFVDNVEIAGATGPSYEADEAGTYRVEVTDRVTGCEKKANAPLVSSSPPVSVSAEVVTNYFDENGTVEVTVEPAGEYEYRLDDGPWQDSNVFTNVRTILSLDQTGTHRLYARDLKACDEKYADITVIDYPKYFTPNGDGYHDTWNISVLSNQPNAKIYIFDRFGKLLKQISTTGSGWDGTFNGQPMPGDDYWFVVKYLEDTVNKEFKAHFALKR